MENLDSDSLRKDLEHYKRALTYMGGDAPIEVLCLPKVIENKLKESGFLRIFELFNTDLTKVKGLGVTRRDILTSRLNELFSINF